MRLLSLAGSMTPAGLRLIIRDLIEQGLVQALVTTGANVVHDLIEAFGYRHEIEVAELNDYSLRRRKIDRMYDIYVTQEAFEKLGKETHKMLAEIDEERGSIATYDLLWEIGKRLNDGNSIIKAAQQKNVPVFCPRIGDSMLGMYLWTFSQFKPLVINPLLDFKKIADMVFAAKKTSVIILGGEVPKHYALAANILRGGVDDAVQITLNRPEGEA
jgi:deoxyhypusine synthase